VLLACNAPIESLLGFAGFLQGLDSSRVGLVLDLDALIPAELPLALA
jgi:hypothetical protein